MTQPPVAKGWVPFGWQVGGGDEAELSIVRPGTAADDRQAAVVISSDACSTGLQRMTVCRPYEDVG
jgi:hypothetical protein